ncbi:hypothetical protein THASP1DRAFT_26893, partial [Thamnocephalis sphaerospora]
MTVGQDLTASAGVAESAAAAARIAFTAQHLTALPRAGGPAVSPDGHQLVYSYYQYFERENRSNKNLWLTSLHGSLHDSDTAGPVVSANAAAAAAATGAARPLTDASFNYTDDAPFWLDGNTVAFLSTRSGQAQLWTQAVTPAGQSPVQLTRFPIDIGNVRYQPRTGLLTFSAEVYADGSMAAAAKRDAEERARKTDSGMVFDSLFVRRWDHFITAKRQNLFAVHVRRQTHVATEASRYEVADEPVNLTPGGELECPMEPFGGKEDYTVSPDGKELAFVAKQPGRDQAWQTRTNVYVVPTDGSARPRSLTESGRGACSHPVYSADGTQLAWLQMTRPGYEADRNQIVVADRKPDAPFASAYTDARRQIATRWDRSPNAIEWSVDGRTLFATAEDTGRTRIFSVDLATSAVHALTDKGSCAGLAVVDEKRLLFSHSTVYRPSEVFLLHLNKNAVAAAEPEKEVQSVQRQQRVTFVSKQVLKNV